MSYELRKLSIGDGQEIYDMLNEMPKDENGFQNSANGKIYEEFEAWLIMSDNISKGIGLQEGWVKQSIFWFFVDDKPVGFGKLRHCLVDHLYKEGGHIGYSIRPSERGKGYGNLLLKLLLEEANKLQINRVLLTIKNHNEKSIKVALKNNGIIEKVTNERHYIWINTGIQQSSENIVIRKATGKDAEALIEYLEIIGGESDFLTFGAGEFGASVELEKQFISNALSRKNSLFIIAEVNGKVVGNLNFTGGPRQRTFHSGEFGVSVLKEYWGKGFGEQLIKYLINWSKEGGMIRKINLRVRTDNNRGIKLYKKLGFFEEGIIKRDFLINDIFYDSMHMGLLID